MFGFMKAIKPPGAHHAQYIPPADEINAFLGPASERLKCLSTLAIAAGEREWCLTAGVAMVAIATW
ncbi:hypothetical protein C2W62_20235 [Candidatus Entotheonella serta]|nr:hypothetical protein C2W62_20235 [Candidatus Entotheonella serta]